MSPVPRRKARILVADDDPTMLEWTAEILTRLGYDVVTAPDGETALRTFLQAPGTIQLVISDGMMPGIGGLQLLRTVSHLSPTTATLLISGAPGILFAAGSATLAKPFRAEALVAKVQGLLAAYDDCEPAPPPSDDE
jgi:DNA-binding response OmpR family regulator